MSDLPSAIEIIEEGPREGFQSEPPIETARKIALIDRLSGTGLTEINCCSFVSPHRVPQMADAERVAAGVTRRQDVIYASTWLNETGFHRAQAANLVSEAVFSSSGSETFLRRNNNRTHREALDDQRRMGTIYRESGFESVKLYVFTAFGCNFEGQIPVAKVLTVAGDLIAVAEESGLRPSMLYLCDTVGLANPVGVERLVGACRDRWPSLRPALHLHDTRGSGIANAYAGLRSGVDRFDASIGGLGGCPFAGNRGAAGNICTEDLTYLCHELGVATGLDLEALVDCASFAEDIVAHPLPSKLLRAGPVRAKAA